MQDIIRFEITELVRDINKDESYNICQKTEHTLYHIYNDIITSEEIENISVLYRLIFYAFQRNHYIAYEILSGFIQFGQSNEGKKYKPLIDHLAIEAFDKLIEIRGWSILRDCLNNLRDNLTNLDAEPIFKHIVSRVAKQLYADDFELYSKYFPNILIYATPHYKTLNLTYSFHIPISYQQFHLIRAETGFVLYLFHLKLHPFLQLILSHTIILSLFHDYDTSLYTTQFHLIPITVRFLIGFY